MKVLCIDMGNTRTHCAVIEDMRVLEAWDESTRCFADSFCYETFKKIGLDGISWCSVVPQEAAKLKRKFEDEFFGIKVFHLNCQTSPINLDVKIPEQVGQDRIAAAIGAGEFFKPPYIIVDMGTAMTIDLVDASGAYAGGAIAPGLHAFTAYLSERTAQLPAIDPSMADIDLVVGKDTLEAMYVGSVKGFCRMVDSIILDMQNAHFGTENASAKTIFTGGSLSVLPKKWLAERKLEVNLANIGLYMAFENFINKK